MSEPVNERISGLLKEAMKAKDQPRLAALRQIKTEIQTFESRGAESVCDDATLLQICQRLKKQRLESIEQYSNAGRDEFAERERAELVTIEEFLPAALGDEELAALVREAIAESGAESPKDVGKVMKAVMPRVAGRADGKTVSAKTRELLS